MLHPPPAVSLLVLIMVALYKTLGVDNGCFIKNGSNGLFLIADQILKSPGPVLILQLMG